MSEDPEKFVDLHESEWSRESKIPQKSPWNWYITDWYDLIAMVIVLTVVFSFVR